MKSKITIIVDINDKKGYKDVKIDSSDKITFGHLVLACVHLMLLVTKESSIDFDETISRLVDDAKSCKKPDMLN
jgi:hypothetical protein